MKIVHVVPSAPYNDYWGYQDNLLTKYHRAMGHNVLVITTNTMHKNGKIVETNEDDYVLNDGTRIIRLKRYKYRSRISTSLRSYIPVYKLLCKYKPDYIFFHGLTSTTIFDVVRYKKEVNPRCVIVQDNHMDPNNNPYKSGIKANVIKKYYRFLNRRSQKYISKVFGVTPWRLNYAREYFGISDTKLDLLIMGADDESIDFDNRETVRKNIRSEHNIAETEFFIVTGGKIDSDKNIDVLIKSCSRFKNVKLLIFGTIADEMKETFDALFKKNRNIIYIGWINSEKVYDYFLSADLVCFPGTHSVMWEQACACKIPCLFKKWEGMDHINNGGNSMFISDVTEENLYNTLQNLIFTEKYHDMKKIAESENTSIYLYSKIAEKSLECFR